MGAARAHASDACMRVIDACQGDMLHGRSAGEEEEKEKAGQGAFKTRTHTSESGGKTPISL